MKQAYKIILPISIVILIILGFNFYWFEWRPSQIKHDCSWVKKHAEPWAERTQEQYDMCCKIREASAFHFNNLNTSNNSENVVATTSCFCEKPHPYRPAIDWYERASSTYYSFCIHEKGL